MSDKDTKQGNLSQVIEHTETSKQTEQMRKSWMKWARPF